MTRFLLAATVLIMLLLFTACVDNTVAGTNEPQYNPQIEASEPELPSEPQPEALGAEPRPAHNHHPLIFNTPEITGSMEISPEPRSDFHLHLDHEQISNLFPLLDMHLRARAYYRVDGSLIEVWAAFADCEMNFQYTIKLGIDGPPTEFSRYSFGGSGFSSYYGTSFQTSYVHGVSVTVLMFDSWHNWFFQAEFVHEDIDFRIRFYDLKENGQALMTEIVNNLILGGTDGLALLADPTIPYMRSEVLSLAEARLDEDFGRFVPTAIPAGFGSSFIHRSIREHEGENRMFMSWEASPDYDYLYDVYTRWVAARTSAAEPWAFNGIFWGNYRLSWTIEVVMEHDLERLVSTHERQKFDWALYPARERYPGDIWGTHDIPGEYWHTVWEPVFLAEDMNLDIVRARELSRMSTTQGAWGDDEDDMNNVVMATPFSEVVFGVLFGDVLVNVRAEGLSAEDVWGMFVGLVQ